jgi:sensor histidine kinase YesM
VIVPGIWMVNFLTMRPGKDIIWAVWPTLGWGLGIAVWGATLWLSANGSLFGPDWEERKVQDYLARANLKRVSSEKQLVQAQLRLLQAQIEPHFLFNTLANVQSLVKRAPDTAQSMLDHFITYLRQSLAASRKTEGTLGQELDLLRNYLEILRLRMGERLRYSLDVPQALTAQPLAPMLLQPLVENAIRHGLEPKAEGGSLRLAARAEGDRLIVDVMDDGLGFSAAAFDGMRPDGSGLGLSNLRERLAVLYDDKASLELIEAQPGTLARVSLPLARAAV